MIVAKSPDRRLFYGSEELHRPSSTNFFARLNAVIGHWGTFCEPLKGAFHGEKNGRPVDPTVYFKIFMVGYLEGIVYDTDLAERIGDSLAIREFIGYGPSERTPDHSSISRARTRMAQDNFLEPVMNKVVAMCIDAGLVSGLEVAADSTLIPANASLSSLRCVTTGISVRDHFNRLREQNKPLTVSNAEFRSPTDEDARIAKKGTTCPKGMYYKVTHVTDAENQVILSALVETADVGDPEAAAAPLKESKQRLEAGELKLGTVVCDAGYDDSKLHAQIEAMDATPLTNYQEPKSPKPEGFAKKDFTYDAERDLYICPNGKLVRRSCKEGDRIHYKAWQSDCAECPFKTLCLAKDTKQRSIKRAQHEAARERNIARCHTDDGRAKLKHRKVVVEPPFGHLKRYGGLRMVNCRTAKRVQVKITIAAIGWNLLKLVRKLGKGSSSRRFASFLTPIRQISIP